MADRSKNPFLQALMGQPPVPRTRAEGLMSARKKRTAELKKALEDKARFEKMLYEARNKNTFKNKQGQIIGPLSHRYPKGQGI